MTVAEDVCCSNHTTTWAFPSPSPPACSLSLVCQICTREVGDPLQFGWLCIFKLLPLFCSFHQQTNHQDKSVVGSVPLNCVYIPVNFQGTHRSRIISSQHKITTKDTLVRTEWNMMGNFISAEGKGTSSPRIMPWLCPSFPCRYPLFIRSENFGTQTYWLTVTLSWYTNSAKVLVLHHSLAASTEGQVSGQ